MKEYFLKELLYIHIERMCQVLNVGTFVQFGLGMVKCKVCDFHSKPCTHFKDGKLLYWYRQ